MADFVRDVIDPESVADGRVHAGFATGFAARDAGYADAGETAASGTKDMADVVICIANDKVEIRLVLREQQARIIASVRVGVRVGVHEQIIVGDEDEANPDFAFVNTVDA